MRAPLFLTVAAVLVAGCSASVSVGDADTAGGSPPAASSSSVPPGDAETAASEPAIASEPPVQPGFALVSGGLAQPGFQNVLDAAALGTTVVATTFTRVTDDDVDAGVVYSVDGGGTWAWGGTVTLPGNQYTGSVMLVPQGAVIVGRTSRQVDERSIDEAFIAVAPSPTFVPQQVPLPAEFDGDVTLIGIEDVAGTWVIVGTEDVPKKGAGAETDAKMRIWRSSDEGGSWARQDVVIDGTLDTSLSQFVIAPDGSWNVFGQSGTESGDSQFEGMWVTSTDAGASWQRVDSEAFGGDWDQGAYRGVFAASGAVGIEGWDEVVETGDEVSVVWAAGSGEPVTRLGGGTVPVEGGTPPGAFVDGLLWDNETLVAWGSSDGEWPMADVQFWAFDGAQFVPTTTLPGNGQLISVRLFLRLPDAVLAVGSVGPDAAERDVAVWRGSLR